jgi:putative redox protein
MGVSAKVQGNNYEGYVVTLRAGKHELVSDEPESMGGTDRGANPFALVGSGLASCTAITLRMYAERKGWPLGDVTVGVVVTRKDPEDRMDRSITVAGPLDDTQRDRLLEIAEKTPVTLVLKRALPISTTLTAAEQA